MRGICTGFSSPIAAGDNCCRRLKFEVIRLHDDFRLIGISLTDAGLASLNDIFIFSGAGGTAFSGKVHVSMKTVIATRVPDPTFPLSL